MSVLDYLKEKEKEWGLKLAGFIAQDDAFELPVSGMELYKKIEKKQRISLVFDKNKKDKDTAYCPSNLNNFLKLIKDGKLTLSFLKIHDFNSGAQGFLCSIQCKVLFEKEAVYLEKTDSNPAYNIPLIKEINKSSGVSLYNEKPFFNLLNYYQDCLAKIEKHPINMVDSLLFSTPLAYEWIQNRIPIVSKPLQLLDHLLEEKLNNYIVNNINVYQFSRINEILDNQYATEVEFDNRVIEDSFINQFLCRAIQNHKSILIASPDEKTSDFYIQKFKESNLSFLIPNHFLSSPLYKFPEELKRVLDNKDSLKSKLTGPVSQKLEKYFYYYKLVTKIIGGGNGVGLIKTGEDSLTGLNKFAYYHELRDCSFNLNVEKYTDKDFDSDNAFLHYLNSNTYVASKSLQELPLYSLRVLNSNKTIYQSLIFTLKKIDTDLDKFESLLKQVKASEWNLGSIDSIEKYRKAHQIIDMLLQYDGFPHTFFELVKDPESMPAAMLLNSKKSEIDSLFEEICESVKEISSLSTEPLKQYIKDIDSKHFFKKRNAKKALKKLLINKNNLGRFIESLRTYIQCTADYSKELEKYEPKFGLLLYSANGAKEILKALNYVTEYNELIKENPCLDRKQNPFVEKIFTDADFREKERNLLADMDIMEGFLNDDFNSYHDFFAKDLDLKKASFAFIHHDLNEKIATSYEDFASYVSYLERRNLSSSTMREALDLATYQNLSLKNFANDYWYSIYKSLAKDYFSSNGFNSIDLYDAMDNVVDYLDLNEAYLTEQALVQTYASIVQHSDSINELIKIYSASPHIQSQVILDFYWDLAISVCPLQILSPNNLPLTDKAHFDFLLLFDSNKYEDEKLFLLLSKADRALILNKKHDERLANYPHYSVREENLYKGSLDYSVLSDYFLNLMAEGFDENGYELQTKEESQTEMPLSFVDKRGVRINVIPDTLLVGENGKKMIFGLNYLLLLIRKTPSCLIPSMSLVVNPKKVIAEAITAIEDFSIKKKLH